MMFVYLVLLFTVLPAVELFILIKLGTVIGALNTLSVILFTGVLGAGLARWQGFVVLRRIQDSLNQGQMPTDDMMDGMMILVGGIVLLTPGLITDILGFLLLIPVSRTMIKCFAKKMIQKGLNRGEVVTFMAPRQRPFNDFDDADFH